MARGRFSVQIAAVVAAASLIVPAAAGAEAFRPPKGKVYTGVSDTGELRHFFRFAGQTGKHPPIMQTFHTWGTGPSVAMRRWATANTRGMLHVHTSHTYRGPGVISPGQIARGEGDDYLQRLNQTFSRSGRIVYIRFMAEMNAYWNAYSAFNSNGSSRGPDHTTDQFKQAWRRAVLIVRGGTTVASLNASLAALGMPPVNRVRPNRPIEPENPAKFLSRAKVAFLWCPQTAGAPNTVANSAGAYYPGDEYVDWVGTDFFSKFPNFGALNGFYRRWSRATGKPFHIGEWSVMGKDSPKFVKKFFRWLRLHPRARMAIYYQGFGSDSAARLDHYPKTRLILKKKLGQNRFPASALMR
jgi:glycosyl hydrolase family 26